MSNDTTNTTTTANSLSEAPGSRVRFDDATAGQIAARELKEHAIHLGNSYFNAVRAGSRSILIPANHDVRAGDRLRLVNVGDGYINGVGKPGPRPGPRPILEAGSKPLAWCVVPVLSDAEKASDRESRVEVGRSIAWNDMQAKEPVAIGEPMRVVHMEGFRAYPVDGPAVDGPAAGDAPQSVHSPAFGVGGTEGGVGGGSTDGELVESEVRKGAEELAREAVKEFDESTSMNYGAVKVVGGELVVPPITKSSIHAERSRPIPTPEIEVEELHEKLCRETEWSKGFVEGLTEECIKAGMTIGGLEREVGRLKDEIAALKAENIRLRQSLIDSHLELDKAAEDQSSIYKPSVCPECNGNGVAGSQETRDGFEPIECDRCCGTGCKHIRDIAKQWLDLNQDDYETSDLIRRLLVDCRFQKSEANIAEAESLRLRDELIAAGNASSQLTAIRSTLASLPPIVDVAVEIPEGLRDRLEKDENGPEVYLQSHDMWSTGTVAHDVKKNGRAFLIDYCEMSNADIDACLEYETLRTSTLDTLRGLMGGSRAAIDGVAGDVIGEAIKDAKPSSESSSPYRSGDLVISTNPYSYPGELFVLDSQENSRDYKSPYWWMGRKSGKGHAFLAMPETKFRHATSDEIVVGKGLDRPVRASDWDGSGTGVRVDTRGTDKSGESSEAMP